MVVSDNHGGLKTARKAVFTGVPWQRCQFHLQQNAMQYVTLVSLRREVAETYLKKTVEKYALIAHKQADWMEVSEEWEYGRLYLRMETG